ncbi:MAG: DUF3800 domain-containing protein [Chloroflexi bacterium]|nr:DUF3800 domain-containing protein [Chloroflexota bacterium]
MANPPDRPNRPHGHEYRYRPYLDESGDHVFNALQQARHRFFCLLGCWFRGPEYNAFHNRLQSFKQVHLPHHPDEPPIFHREDILHRRGAFTHLQDPEKAQEFDTALLTLIGEAEFRMVGVVIDKQSLRARYADAAAHPYYLALGFLLQRYCGHLNFLSRVGDVMAESRGRREDLLLMDSYTHIYSRGAWTVRAETFQQALTSKELKVKKKSANIAGLQLADILAHPVRQAILREMGHLAEPAAPFDARLMPVIEQKFNRHLFDGRVEGYGKVFFPK